MVFVDLSPPAKILIHKSISTSLIMAIGSESVKIKLQKLSWMSFRENFIPRNFLAIRYECRTCVQIARLCNAAGFVLRPCQHPILIACSMQREGLVLFITWVISISTEVEGGGGEEPTCPLTKEHVSGMHSSSRTTYLLQNVCNSNTQWLTL